MALFRIPSFTWKPKAMPAPPEEGMCSWHYKTVIWPLTNMSLGHDVEKCQDRMECFNADLKADMERWQNNKRQDFRQLLMGMADKNIQYYEKVMS